jgi:hypothetical protein
VKIADHRLDVPRRVPFVAPFNKWMTKVPGTTYFLPVVELSALYINVLLSAFDDDFAMFFIDDHHGYHPPESPRSLPAQGNTSRQSGGRARAYPKLRGGVGL